MKKRLFQVLFYTILVAHLSFGQDITLNNVDKRQNQENANTYSKAIGVKMYPGAITFKKFNNQNTAIEAIGYFNLDGFSLTMLKEFHTPIIDVENLSWYYGYGAHLGIWSDEWKKNNVKTNNSNIAVGLDGIIGLDYKFINAPFNFTIDWQPSFSIIQSYFNNQGGIGIRYTF
jgi:hypothetical protein